jgi:hypothetical protein
VVQNAELLVMSTGHLAARSFRGCTGEG